MRKSNQKGSSDGNFISSHADNCLYDRSGYSDLQTAEKQKEVKKKPLDVFPTVSGLIFI